MNRSTPGLPVHHQLPEFTETHVHRVSDAIQPSHPLSSPSPLAPNPSQHQSLFQCIYCMANRRGKSGTVTDFIFLGSKITADGDCSHEIKTLAPWKKSYDNLDSVLKSRDITLLTKVLRVKAMVFPVVMYRCESGP